MTRTAIGLYAGLPFVIVFAIMALAEVVTTNGQPMPELEIMEGFMWAPRP